MIAAEDALIEQLSVLHEVDGHDAGVGEVNIFILTNDYRKAFDEAKAALEGKGFWADACVAYREIDKSEYTVLWPEGLNEFNVS